jgi:citrate lyase subunit alpha/citrate CoA-transferase
MKMNKLPEGFRPFVKADDYLNHPRKSIPIVYAQNQGPKLLTSVKEVFDVLGITDGMTLSFHHHLRNGDDVLNQVMREIQARNLKNITLAPSSLFPNQRLMCELIENGNVTRIYTNYLNGDIGKTICQGKMKDLLIMDTHGGRGYAIESGDIKIDVAFIATPCCDQEGNGHGRLGPSACGSLGYAIPDMLYAKRKVAVTDYLVPSVENPEIQSRYIDYVLKVDKLGEQSGIVSGTTKITRDPIGLKIASDTAKLLDKLGLIENGFSMQTGAGGTTLAVAKFVRDLMLKKGVKAKFACGGITGYYVQMLEEGLIEELYDVQCFDLDAVRSIGSNPNHHAISAFEYANPYEENAKVNQLDFVILGATEIDLNFNVNVTTTSHGLVIGGSGGHSDTAHGAKVSIIVTPLIKTRIPIIKERVTTITTPGEDVDILVTEQGIAINPLRKDLLEKLQNSKLKIYTIEELYKKALATTGVPNPLLRSQDVVGLVRYRDQTVIDLLYKI